MKNIQCLIHSGGINKYICKYVGEIDENDHIIVRAHVHDKGVLISQSTFLNNTKISSSAINEMKALQKSRGKNHSTGQEISHMEIMKMLWNYPQVHKDMTFHLHTSSGTKAWCGKEVKYIFTGCKTS